MAHQNGLLTHVYRVMAPVVQQRFAAGEQCAVLVHAGTEPTVLLITQAMIDACARNGQLLPIMAEGVRQCTGTSFNVYIIEEDGTVDSYQVGQL